DVAVIFIRPQRYTFDIIENSEYFTVNFLSGKYKDALNICGAASGRDCDKFERVSLSPHYVDGTTAVEQATLAIVCKKIATTDMKPEDFLDKSIEGFYPGKDYHRVFVGEIVRVLEK
ncbi:MAG: flavin reductase, partial [Oscillospiraceae bacterium]